MTAAPSVSNSITVRLELPARATAVSELTTAIERSGGLVTGLDVTASGHQRLRVDVTAAARDQSHAEDIVEAMRAVHGVEIAQGQRPHLPGAPRRQADDRVEGADPQPRRPVADLHPGRRTGLPGHRREPRGRPAPHHQAQHGRGRDRRLRRARAGQHRPAGGAAGDGGQGGAVQALRRHRRVPDLPRHPGRRGDRRRGQGHRAGLRGHQPGGHLGPALLRGRGPPARGARHPRLPRRPARHGHRRAGGPAQRAAGGRQGPHATSGSS